MGVLTDVQKVVLGPIGVADAAGNPAQIDGAPVWTSANPDVVSLEVAPDGLSATATAVGPLGGSQVSVTVDADLGAGVVPIVGLAQVDVIASQAVSVSVPFGTPTDK